MRLSAALLPAALLASTVAAYPSAAVVGTEQALATPAPQFEKRYIIGSVLSSPLSPRQSSSS